jgi:hypothetical protein
MVQDAIKALHQLGFSLAASRKAVNAATADKPSPCSLPELIRASLRHAPKPTSTGARERRAPYQYRQRVRAAPTEHHPRGLGSRGAERGWAR